MNKGKLIQHIVKIFILLALAAIATFAAVKFAPQIAHLATNPEELKNLLSSYGSTGIVIFILIQIIQVIIAFLPGDVTQLAGGYVYGTMLGTLYSTIGITIGSIIVFYTSRFLGYPLINLMMPKELFEKFSFLINSPKAEMTMFIIFLIPGMPKDFLSYIAGVTPVKPMTFLVLTSIARFPALFISTYIGANLQRGNFTAVIITTVISCIVILAGFLMKDRILAILHGDSQKKDKKIELEKDPEASLLK
jgi:uncharacterized membrane protein YdjX (TVP38/TMEM64 family)